MIIRELIAKLGFTLDDQKLKKFDSQLGSANKKLSKIGSQARGLGRDLSLFLTLPITAAGAAMVKAASDAEETNSKFNTIFKDIQSEANNVATSFARNFGLASTKSRELLGDTSDLLTGFNFTQETALDLSRQVNELAVDLASFTNFQGGAAGASQALTKALLGERESVKSLGISILEEDVKAQMLKDTQEGLTFETERQAKAFATLRIAQQQSQNAIGDYARTQQSFANRSRVLGARVQDLAESFGKILLPVATSLLNKTVELVEFFTDLSETSKTLIIIVGGLLAVVGPLVFLFGALIGITTTAITAFMGLSAAIGVTNLGLALLGLKFLAIGALVAAGLAIAFLVIDDLIAYFKGEGSVTAVIIEEMGKAVDFLSEKFNELPGVVQGVMAMILTPIRASIAAVRTLGGVLGALSGGDFGGALDAIGEGLKNTFDPEAVTGQGIGGLLGFGPDNAQQNAQAGSNVNVNSPIEVNVPPGTPPEEAANAVQRGVKESIEALFTEAGRNVASPIAE